VWANDPNSPRATVIHGDTHWPVVKYGGHKTISPTRTLLTTPPTASTTSATTAVTPTRILTKTPTKGPTQTSGPPPPSPVSAHIRSLSDGDEVGRCEIVSGDVDVPAGKTLFLAQRRTRPTDSTYYFVYAGPPTGVTGKSWSVRRYFGTAPPQEYSVLLLIVDVDVAAQFWESHRIPNQGYAAATRLPVEPADTVNVRQTSLEDPC
jgi:hypothetical protein